MPDAELETQKTAASYGRSAFRPGQTRPAVVIRGFEHEVMYPGHNHGTDGRLHVPAESFTEHSVKDVVEVSIATDSLDVVSSRVQKLVDFANGDISRGDLVVPQIEGATQAENLTAYLKIVIDQQTREVARRLLFEHNQSEDNRKTLVKDIIDDVATHSPELAFRLSEKYEGVSSITTQSIQPEIVIEPTQEHLPTTLDKILATPMGTAVLRYFPGILKHTPSRSLERAS